MTLLTYQTVQEMALSIAKGNEIPGYYLVQKFGTNEAIGTNFAPVTDGGTYPTPQSSGAVALRVKAGGNAADAPAGAGAWEVTILGLDEDFEHAAEALVTAGASASALSTTTFTRVPRVRVTGSGTYANATAGSHVGEITIEDAAGNIWAHVHANGFPYATTQIAAYSVAANEIAYMVHNDVFTDSSKKTKVLMFIRENIDETEAPYGPMRVVNPFTMQGGKEGHDLSHAPIKITGPADVGFMANVDVGTATVSAGFELLVQRLRPDKGKTHKESRPAV